MIIKIIDGWLYVEWDISVISSYRYGYFCVELNKYDVRVCYELRILENEMIVMGCFVIRGN